MKALFLLLTIILSTTLIAQRNKKKDAAAEALENMDGDELALKIASNSACKCMDSVYTNNKMVKATDKELTNCITTSVSMYDMTKQMMAGIKSKEKNVTILVGKNENTKEFQTNYYAIERRMKDSCKILNFILTTGDTELSKSVSTNKEALALYDEGIDYHKKENYSKALVYFEKAVKIDSVFAFAWDNIGVCYRRLGNYEKAIAAYKESLKLEPSGQTALQNIAVAYNYLKKYDEAIAAYEDMLKYDANNPEVFYGIGTTYFFHKKDNEKALENICKAYNIYTNQKSPYRADAEKVINYIYSEMKKEKKENRFMEILKENGINPSGN